MGAIGQRRGQWQQQVTGAQALEHLADATAAQAKPDRPAQRTAGLDPQHPGRAAVDIVQRNPNPSEATIRHELEGNICRCTGYHNIVKAVQAGAETMRG